MRSDASTMVEQRIARAVEATGLDDLGTDSWRPGLENLLDALDTQGHLSEGGWTVLDGYIQERLCNRLRLVGWTLENPDVRRELVEAPVFVVGMSRTGTTLLHNLLAADPGARSLLKWEALDSIPPPDGGQLDDDPRVGPSIASTEAMYDGAPELRAMHYEAGDGPTECGMLLGQDFRCVDVAGMAHIPAYTDWLFAADAAPAYRYHRLALQVLGWAAPGNWTLKAPYHLMALDALADEYPDASIVVTHRDPTEAVASTCKLVSLGTSSLGEADPLAVARQWLELLGAMTDRLVDFDARRGDRVLHVRYSDLVAEPLAAIDGIYRHSERAFTDAADIAMRAYLDDNPQGKHGRVEYSLEEFGLSAGEVDERFSAYRERFGI